MTHKANRGLLVAALVLLLGGSTFAIVNLSSSGGAQSPEAAVDGLLSAVSNQDVIGVLEALDPRERESLQGPVEDLFTELDRLDLVVDADLRDFQGIDLEIEGYRLITTQYADDVAAVSVGGGTITGAATPQELPIGDTLRSILEDDFDVEIPAGTERDTEDLGEFQLMVTRTGGSWYVSPGYSIAEAARQGTDAPVPAFDGSLAPVGGESPEAAVQSLADAASALDARAAIAALDPHEMGALYAYAPLFLDDADRAAAQWHDDDFTWDFQITASRSVDGPRGSRIVLIDGFEMHIEDDWSSVTASFDGECLSVEEEYDYGFGYGGSGWDDEEVTDICVGDAMEIDGVGDLSGFVDLEVGFVTVQRDGRWYVAPVRTGMHSMVALLQALTGDDIEVLREWFRNLADPWESTMRFEEVGEAIDVDDWWDDDGWDDVDPYASDICYDRVDALYDEFWEHPVHADGSYGRWSYLEDVEWNACLDELVADGEIDAFVADGLRWAGDACWEAYEALPDGASVSDWEAADLEVAACIDEQWRNDDPPGSTEPFADDSGGGFFGEDPDELLRLFEEFMDPEAAALLGVTPEICVAHELGEAVPRRGTDTLPVMWFIELLTDDEPADVLVSIPDDERGPIAELVACMVLVQQMPCPAVAAMPEVTDPRWIDLMVELVDCMPSY